MFLPLVITGIAAVLVAAFMLIGLLKDIKKRGLHRVTYRWFTGHALDGQYYTNASWFRRGEHVRHAQGRVIGWHHWPRIVRAGIRWAITLYVLGTLYGLYVSVTATVWALAVSVALGAVSGLALAVVKARTYWKGTRLVTPLAAALGLKFGTAPAETQNLITLEPGWDKATNGRIGRIKLPPHFAAVDGEKKTIEAVVSNRLPVGVDFRWHTATGRGGYLDIHASPPLPHMVLFRDYLKQIEKNKPGEYVAGIRASGEVVRLSFMGDYVHHACSFNTGRGKSSYIMNMLAQILDQNPENRATVLDTKMESLEPFTGIPGVDIWADPQHIEDMVEGARKVFEIMKYRLTAQSNDPTLKGTWPMELLILEEGNDFSVQLSAWWDDNKPKGAKATPPMWSKIVAPILWQGRSVNVHMFAVFQSFMERFFGNLNLRPSFGMLALSGYRPNQWKAMVGTSPVPKAQKGKGRVILTDGDEEYWIQALYDDPDYLRAFAERNRVDTVQHLIDLNERKEIG